MRHLLKRLLGSRPAAPPERKAFLPVITLESLSGREWSGYGGAGLANTGFTGNPVVYRCVRAISEAAASLPWLAYEQERESPHHEALALLARPNMRQDGRSFLESAYGHLLLSGNAFLHAVLIEDEPRELHVLSPGAMSPVAQEDGWPDAWDYRVGKKKLRLRCTGPRPPLCHVALFNPLDPVTGMPPLMAARIALETHNSAGLWNKALLDNSARPSGALVYNSAEGANLTHEQFARLKQELDEGYCGAEAAGRPMVLEGGLDWKAMAYSPRDMDFIEARNGAARDIALAFGVPPMLLGIPGDNTYANYSEANRAFWRQTVLPLAGRMAAMLSAWLGEFHDTALTLDFDRDPIEALAPDRNSLWRRLDAAQFLTMDEKRAAAGYGPLGDGSKS